MKGGIWKMIEKLENKLSEEVQEDVSESKGHVALKSYEGLRLLEDKGFEKGYTSIRYWM